jgi:DUF1680 family protein
VVCQIKGGQVTAKNRVNAPGPVDTSRSPFVQLQTLPLGALRFKPGFWAGIQEINHRVSLKHGYQMIEKAGNLHNFRLAAGLVQGSYRGRNFLDSDVYKWLEAIAWELARDPDEELQDIADEVIQLIGAAQCPDGYLNCYVQVVQPEARWTDLDHGHELYCAGHLFQAGVAFSRATGDLRLLDISCRFADLICSVFGPGKRAGTCGHPEIEMALIELYRVTGEKRYLEMAQFFIDQRGQKKMVGYAPYGPEYHQDHVPLRQAVAAEGHAVRQLYLTAGATDLYLETGEQALWDAMVRLWRDIVGSKLYITGGVGSRYDGEAFGDPYELPADQCYCETCATIADVLWNWRMLLATGEGRYADLIERSLYNGILSSPALDGKHYFYVNPLMVRGGGYTRLSSNPPEGEAFTERPEWHSVACCPPNVMRLFSSLEHYFASSNASGIQVHQYAPMEISVQTPAGGRIVLSVETEYPWQGNIHVTVKETGDATWQLSLRRPEWCQAAALAVNGEKVGQPVLQKGYFVLEREWRVGDTTDLDLVIQPTLVESNPRVDATRGCLAIQRGPVVYCLESHDQQVQDNLLDVQIDANQPLQSRWQDDLLGGTMTVEAAGYLASLEPWQGVLYRPVEQVPVVIRRPVRLVAIPYYAWGNRGIGSMRVWIPQGVSAESAGI